MCGLGWVGLGGYTMNGVPLNLLWHVYSSVFFLLGRFTGRICFVPFCFSSSYEWTSARKYLFSFFFDLFIH